MTVILIAVAVIVGMIVLGAGLFVAVLLIAHKLDVLNGYTDQMGCQGLHGEYVDD